MANRSSITCKVQGNRFDESDDAELKRQIDELKQKNADFGKANVDLERAKLDLQQKIDVMRRSGLSGHMRARTSRSSRSDRTF